MKVFSFKRATVKRMSAILAVAAAVVTVPAALLAWGPTRATYTMAHPADHVVFNSMTDNSVVGDERQFVGIKDASNTAAGGWQNSIAAQPGHEYLVRVYVHNNAASNLNLVATNTRVTAALSTATGKSVPITGYVSADNASPQSVYADVNLTSAQDFNIVYQPGSAMIYNNATGAAGRQVSDSIVNAGGALIGYTANDGKLPGCFEYASFVTFKVKPQFAAKPDFSIVKDVRKDGTTTYGQTSAVNPGDKVNYRITFKNTGETALNNVVLKDALPAGVSYVPGTAKLQNSNYQYPNMYSVPDTLFSTGANIGDYAAGGNAYITFTGQVAAKDKMPCGPQTLVNTATVSTGFGNKSDTADVTTTGNTCVPVVPVYTCDSLKVDQLSRTSFKFTTTTTVKDATLKSIVYVVRDASGKEVSRSENATYTQTTAGKYTVEAIVTVTVNGVDKVAPGTNCKGQFEVKPEVEKKPIKVCDLGTKTVITIDEKDFDSSKHSKNLDDCKQAPVVKVCEVKTGRIVTIKESDMSSAYTTDLAKCAMPAELPTTGPADAIAKLAGLVSLSSATAYYLASRRQ